MSLTNNILAFVETSSTSITNRIHRPLCPYSCLESPLFQVLDYLPLAHNLDRFGLTKGLKVYRDSLVGCVIFGVIGPEMAHAVLFSRFYSDFRIVGERAVEDMGVW